MGATIDSPRPAGWQTHAMILAGGRGERMRPFIEEWLGDPRPKQFCTFVGARSMLQHTYDRIARVVPEGNVVTVIGASQKRYARQLPGARLFEQPSDRGTGLPVLLTVARLLDECGEGSLMVLPADHFVHPEASFQRYLISAFLLSRRLSEEVVLLTVVPDHAETDYGWVVPKSRPGALEGMGAVELERFVEKPPLREAEDLLAGGGMWNTLTMVARVRTLWSLGWELCEETMHRIESYLDVLRAVRRGAIDARRERRALERCYEESEVIDLSRDLLQRASSRLVALPMQGLTWSDWGRPQRVRETLESMGREPLFARARAS